MESKVINIRIKRSVPLEKQAQPNKATSRMSHIIRNMMIIITDAAVGFTAGVSVASWAIPYATKERGYAGAIGGEFLLIPAAAFIAAYLCNKILCFLYRLIAGKELKGR